MGNSLEGNHRGGFGDCGSVGHIGVYGMKRSVTLIVVHCTATRVDADFTQKDLLRSHKARGMRMVGYHFYIRKDGFIWSTRPLEMEGAHCKGYNQESVGIAYEGGLNENGHPADTRTPEQKHSLRVLIRTLKHMFPIKQVCGHRDLSLDRNGNGVVESSEWLKQCPCFDVATDQWCA